jgi:CheY-like chemotaxis protein/CHASE3 domain sensor protein
MIDLKQSDRRNYLGIHLFIVTIISILCLNGWYLYRNFNGVTAQEGWVRHTNNILNQLASVESAIVSAESAVRGYGLTGRADYLTPYQEQSVLVWKYIEKLKDLTAGSPDQQDNVRVLEGLVRARLEPLAELTKYKALSAKDREANLELGFARMTALKQQVDKIQAIEAKLLEQRTLESQKSRTSFQWNVLGSFALTFILMLLAYWLVLGNEKKNEAEIKERKLQAWIQSQVNELSQLITNSGPLDKACEQALEFLAQATGALAGNLYLKENGRLTLSGSFAGETFEKSKDAPVSIEGKTLVSEALKKRSVWIIPDVPADSLKISSSLASAKPATLVFIPLIFQNIPLAVVELAFLGRTTPELEKLLEVLREPMAVNLNAAASKAQLQMLLEETQQQAEELQTQQEELRTNNEELEQQARALEAQQEIVNQQNEALEASKAKLEIKAQDLEKISQYKSDFLAKMSHELRTPLNSLLILATLLIENKEKNLTDQQKDFAKTMYNAGNDLLNLINDILDLSKIEARKLSLRFEDFSLSQFFERLRQTFEPQAANKKLEFKIEIQDALKGMSLRSDSLRVEQVLRNFLSNAIKFTESGGVAIRAEFQSGYDDQVRITVRDTGVGIPREKQELIFEAFEQADGTVSRKFGGTGLGLTISRELASLLGGHIELSSQEGEGSEFALILPLRYSSSSEAPTVIQSPRVSRGAERRTQTAEKASHPPDVSEAAQSALKAVTGEKNTILIVEDDRIFRQSILDTVRSYGFDAIEADSSEMALQILNSHVPTAILLDVKLPGMSGLGLLEMIKQNPKWRHIPVHMISALEYQSNALRMGALGYLSKPVTVDKVRSALTRIETMLEKNVKNLLVVEDDDRQREAVAQLVAGKDIHVLSARTGEEALQRVHAQTVDCIILDLNLPDMSGFDFLEKVNALPISVPPIVIYTGKDLSRTEEQNLRKYSESIIIKGARSPERLLDEVNLFLHRVESLLPQEKQDILQHLRTQEKHFEGKKVLLVDDDLRNVFALTSALETKGLTVRIAKNGIEALESLKQHPDADIVLMDLMMPRMDGLEAIRRIREQSQFKELPIIALTAKAMKEDQDKCIEAGANDYLSKPLNLGNLLSVMRVWLTPKGIFL